MRQRMVPQLLLLLLLLLQQCHVPHALRALDV